jgi:uncharacterized membrane protein YcaP (DUF421 family)
MNDLPDLLGRHPDELTFLQIALRSVIVFVVTLALLRLANRRFLGQHAAFDAVLAIILGSVLSRAVNGAAPFFPSLGGGAVLLALHWLFGAIAFRSRTFRVLVRGQPRVLIENGSLHRENMRSTHVTEEDLIEELRCEARINRIADAELAHLECNGRVSVIARARK